MDAGTVEKREDGYTYFRGRFVHTSRGKHYAKHAETGEWARRPTNSAEDVLVLDRPGKWMIHSNDGFRRRQTEYIMVE